MGTSFLFNIHFRFRDINSVERFFFWGGERGCLRHPIEPQRTKDKACVLEMSSLKNTAVIRIELAVTRGHEARTLPLKNNCRSEEREEWLSE